MEPAIFAEIFKKYSFINEMIDRLTQKVYISFCNCRAGRAALGG